MNTAVPPNESTPASWSTPANLATALLLLVAVAARRVGLFTEPWQDEIWSLQFAQRATSIGQFLTDDFFHVDNNHWLNTIWMFLLGNQQAFWPYRLLSLVSGLGLLVPVWVLARRWGWLAPRLAVVLVGLSFMFVEYGTEARGYGPAVGFAVLAAWATVGFVEGRHRTAMAGVTAVASVLGLLGHATFLFALAGLAVYAGVGLYRREPRIGRIIPRFAGLLFVPILFAGWLYVTAIGPMRFGGGPHVPMEGVLSATFFFTTGVPTGSGWVGLAIAAAVSGYGAIVLMRAQRDEWVLLLTAGWIAPGLILLIHHPQPLYARYLFLALPFVLLLTAAGLADLFGRTRPAQAIAGLLLAGFVAGNAVQLWQFSQVGRGQFRPMLDYLAQHTAGPDVMLTADTKFRFAMPYRYFADRPPTLAKRYGYVPPESPVPPEWFVADAGMDQPIPQALTVHQWPDVYVFVTKFDVYGMSGAQWRVYHRLDRPR